MRQWTTTRRGRQLRVTGWLCDGAAEGVGNWSVHAAGGGGCHDGDNSRGRLHPRCQRAREARHGRPRAQPPRVRVDSGVPRIALDGAAASLSERSTNRPSRQPRRARGGVSGGRALALRPPPAARAPHVNPE